jgi:hypothetical protein
MRHRRRRPEDEIQRALFAHIRLHGVPGLCALHPANGGYRRPVEAKILKGCGVTSGAPDVLLWHAGKAFAMELKADGAGKASDSQVDMLERLSEAGVRCALCYGLDQALRCLQDWGLLRGRLQ